MPLLTQAKSVLDEVISTRGLKARFFDNWESDLDHALRHLPEHELLSHQAFRALMLSEADRAKRKLALVTDRGEPVAVVGLKNRQGWWEPVTQWIIPGVLFPVKSSDAIAAVLAALQLEIRIGWWRWEIPPPEAGWIKDVVSMPSHGSALDESVEKYWRDTDFFKDVRYFRNRCRGMSLGVNLAGARERTIRSWSAKWSRDGAQELPGLTDRLLITEELEKRGKFFTLSLLDGEAPAAEWNVLVHRGDLVAYLNYRNPKYDRQGAMTHLMDRSITWAIENRFTRIDVGGSYDYKKAWFPVNGLKWEFNVKPRLSRLKARARKLGSKG
jgi:hypothetical protein